MYLLIESGVLLSVNLYTHEMRLQSSLKEVKRFIPHSVYSIRNDINCMPTTLVVQVEQSSRCACLSVCLCMRIIT